MRVRDLRNYAEVPHAYLGALLSGKRFMPVSSNGNIRAEEDGTRVLRLHCTDVVTAYADGTVILRNGGYNTVTTRQRLRSVLPACVRVFNRAYSCYVETRDEYGEWHCTDFADGMRLHVSQDAQSARVITEAELREARAEAQYEAERAARRHEAETADELLRKACAEEDGTKEHAHVWSNVANIGRFTGNAYRACLVPFCKFVSDLDEEDADETAEVTQ